MATFEPPTDPKVSPVSLDPREQRSLGNRLMRFYAPRPRGRNVYLLTNGTITETFPAATYVNGQPTATAWGQVTTVWWGGHSAEITADEQTALTLAGYGAYIT